MKNETFAKGIKISSDGIVDVITFKGAYVCMEELQNSVKGCFEFVYLPNNFILVVNEEGKINNSKYNEVATLIVFYLSIDLIYGDVLLIEGKYLE